MKRFDVYLVQLDPTRGSEIRKTRPAVILSPDEMLPLKTVIVAPMTTKGRPAPFRMDLVFDGKAGRVLLDQLRTVDKSRLVKHMGALDRTLGGRILDILREMFAD